MSAQKLRIFISWSEERARLVGKALDEWLPDVLQYTDPFFSPTDIAAGTPSMEELDKELDASDFGITCLTPENIARPWVLYETGALAHKFKHRACPYLLDIEPTDVPPPLGKLQGVRADRDGTLKLLQGIEAVAGERAVGAQRLERLFEKWWPSLKEALGAIPKPKDGEKKPRKTEDMLAEILETVRGIDSRGREGSSASGFVVSLPGGQELNPSAFHVGLEELIQAGRAVTSPAWTTKRYRFIPASPAIASTPEPEPPAITQPRLARSARARARAKPRAPRKKR